MKKIIYLGFVFSFIWILVFCSDEGVVPYKKEYFFPADNISYYEHVLPLIDAKCGFGSGCHNAENSTNFLFYETKEAFINHEIGSTGFFLVRQEIDRHNPNLSHLYLLLTENLYLGFDKMPPLIYGREPLKTGELKGIEQWIREGSKD